MELNIQKKIVSAPRIHLLQWFAIYFAKSTPEVFTQLFYLLNLGLLKNHLCKYSSLEIYTFLVDPLYFFIFNVYIHLEIQLMSCISFYFSCNSCPQSAL